MAPSSPVWLVSYSGSCRTRRGTTFPAKPSDVSIVSFPASSTSVKPFDSSSTPMASVTVPTAETCSVAFWMQTLVDMKRPVMLAGPAGVGKTQMVLGMLHKLDPAKMTECTVNFNF